jgi:protein-S-isoprenylcysteine O-methyltransferase Ste14
LGTPLLLGSWWGLALAPGLMAVLVARILIEEKTLRAELPGYDEYAARVRYRLIPLIW